MKRSLILLGAVTATLASCSKSEVVDVNDSQAIGFETFVNKSTRAVTNDEGTVTNIGLKTVPISSQPSVREREPIFPPILVIATATWS